jgi:predicted amidophosphoribosyltransferase
VFGVLVEAVVHYAALLRAARDAFRLRPGPGILSMEAIADPPAYNHARAAVRFDEISRALVHALKYGDRLDLAPMMGRWISQAGRELLAEANGLVRVPLHWRRLWARRFNQSAILATTVSRQTGVPVAAGALKRVKPTAQQVGLSRTERADNVQGAFRVPAHGNAALTGRRLVLIDDVLTSGQPATAVPAHYCAPEPPVWMCWFLPGLPSRHERPYKTLLKIATDHGQNRYLYRSVLPLLPRRQGTPFA